MNGQLHSCIYRGQVVHRRFRPVPHQFAYRVFWLYLDLEELPAPLRSLRLLSIGGRNLVSFRIGDHGPCDGSPLVPWVLAELRREGIVLAQPRIRLLAFPRLLGYAFNPLSVFYCHDGQRLAAVIYQVRNTFGGRHCYVLPVEAGSRHGCEKSFHVSPFLGMGGSYRFTLRPPGLRLGLSIREHDEQGLLLLACMSGARMPLCDRAILSCLVRDPLMTWKVMGAIHIEALRLWLKGVQHFTRPAAGGPGMRV